MSEKCIVGETSLVWSHQKGETVFSYTASPFCFRTSWLRSISVWHTPHYIQSKSQRQRRNARAAGHRSERPAGKVWVCMPQQGTDIFQGHNKHALIHTHTQERERKSVLSTHRSNTRAHTLQNATHTRQPAALDVISYHNNFLFPEINFLHGERAGQPPLRRDSNRNGGWGKDWNNQRITSSRVREDGVTHTGAQPLSEDANMEEKHSKPANWLFLGNNNKYAWITESFDLNLSNQLRSSSLGCTDLPNVVQFKRGSSHFSLAWDILAGNIVKAIKHSS